MTREPTMCEDFDFEFYYDNYEYDVVCRLFHGVSLEELFASDPDEWADYEPEGILPNDHILNVLFECRPGYRLTCWWEDAVELFGVAPVGNNQCCPLVIHLAGSTLDLSFGQRPLCRIDLNDPESLDRIQRCLDSFPHGFGVSPIRLRSTEEDLA